MTLDGGLSARADSLGPVSSVLSAAASVDEDASAATDAVAAAKAESAAAADCRFRLRLGSPSSVTSAISVSGWPTRAVNSLSPMIRRTGTVFDLVSGLLVPAPSAPVSEAITMLSTL